MDNLKHIVEAIGQGIGRQKLARTLEDLLRLVGRGKEAELTVQNVANNNPLQPMDLLEKVSIGQFPKPASDSACLSSECQL